MGVKVTLVIVTDSCCQYAVALYYLQLYKKEEEKCRWFLVQLKEENVHFALLHTKSVEGEELYI